LDPEIDELRDLYLAYEKRKVEEELIEQRDIVSRKDKTTRDENNTKGQTNTEDDVPK
jgi:hypothetical protein